jgi:hypothetical protein
MDGGGRGGIESKVGSRIGVESNEYCMKERIGCCMYGDGALINCCIVI